MLTPPTRPRLHDHRIRIDKSGCDVGVAPEASADEEEEGDGSNTSSSTSSSSSSTSKASKKAFSKSGAEESIQDSKTSGGGDEKDEEEESDGSKQEDLFGDRKEPGKPEPPEADWETRLSRVRMGSHCGLNRISPIFDDERNEIGYEYHCKHPLH